MLSNFLAQYALYREYLKGVAFHDCTSSKTSLYVATSLGIGQLEFEKRPVEFNSYLIL